MKIELNLVKTQTTGAKIGKLLSRRRYEVENESGCMDAIVSFIKEIHPNLSIILTDKALLNKLEALKALTVSELDCLRYVLSTRGIDIWYGMVADVEQNGAEVPAGVVEYNVYDGGVMTGFVPFCTKFPTQQDSNKLTALYDKILDSYGLFRGDLFSGIANPIKSMVDSMRGDEELLGVASTTKTTYINSILEYLKKDIRVITE